MPPSAVRARVRRMLGVLGRRGATDAAGVGRGPAAAVEDPAALLGEVERKLVCIRELSAVVAARGRERCTRRSTDPDSALRLRHDLAALKCDARRLLDRASQIIKPDLDRRDRALAGAAVVDGGAAGAEEVRDRIERLREELLEVTLPEVAADHRLKAQIKLERRTLHAHLHDDFDRDPSSVATQQVQSAEEVQQLREMDREWEAQEEQQRRERAVVINALQTLRHQALAIRDQLHASEAQIDRLDSKVVPAGRDMRELRYKAERLSGKM